MGLWSTVSHVVGGAVHSVTSPVAKAVGYVGTSIKSAGNAVVHAVGSAGKAVGNGIVAVEQKAEKVVNTVYHDSVALVNKPIDLASKTLDKGFDLLSSPFLLIGAAAVGIAFLNSRK